MKLEIYAVFDDATETFLQPFFVKTEKEAYRALDACLGQEGQISRFPDDHYLYRLGDYNNVSGALNGLSNPHRVIGCRERIAYLTKLKRERDEQQLQLVLQEEKGAQK